MKVTNHVSVGGPVDTRRLTHCEVLRPNLFLSVSVDRSAYRHVVRNLHMKVTNHVSVGGPVDTHRQEQIGPQDLAMGQSTSVDRSAYRHVVRNLHMFQELTCRNRLLISCGWRECWCWL